MKVERKLAMKIGRLREKIERAADVIEKYNPENLHYYEWKEKNKATSLAKQLIEKYNINFYQSLVGVYDEVFEVLASKTVEEFVENLEKYVKEMQDWAETEAGFFDASFYEETREVLAKEDGRKYKYFVVIWRIYPVCNDSQIEEVVWCKDEATARALASYAFENWGDFGVVGGNIDVEVYKNTDKEFFEIAEKVREDYLRFSKSSYSHCYNGIKISYAEEDYKDVLEDLFGEKEE